MKFPFTCPCRHLLAWVAKEPLVHFLALGAFIFGAYALFGPQDIAAEGRIVVTSSDVARLRALSVQQWGRAPDSRQMEELLKSYVREEVLYRTALARGLDKDDIIIRRRLAQKMEFLANEEVRAPGEEEMRQYFATHPAKFLQPAKADFEQIYFNPDQRGANTEADAQRALEALKQGKTVHADGFMLAGRQLAQERSIIARDFGDEFARSVFSLSTGAWFGPIRSPHGVHLLRVVDRKPGVPARFEALRDRIATELVNERVASARNTAYARLLAGYAVVLPTQHAELSVSPTAAARP